MITNVLKNVHCSSIPVYAFGLFIETQWTYVAHETSIWMWYLYILAKRSAVFSIAYVGGGDACTWRIHLAQLLRYSVYGIISPCGACV